MDWETLKPDKELAQSTLKKRNQQIAYVNLFLNKNGLDPNDPLTYKKLTLELVHEFLGKRSTHTKIGYIDVFEVLTIHFGGSSELVRQLIRLRAELIEQARIDGSSKVPVKVDEPFKQTMEEVKSSDQNMNILRDISLSSFAGMRLSDLIHTRVTDDDGTHSYLNMETGHWSIRTRLRKGEDRILIVPPDLMDKLRQYSFREGWLLSNKAGFPFEISASISSKFQRTYGMTYGSIRKGACDAVHEKDDIKETIAHAKIMGHSTHIELAKYVSTPPDSPIEGYDIEWPEYDVPKFALDKEQLAARRAQVSWEISV